MPEEGKSVGGVWVQGYVCEVVELQGRKGPVVAVRVVAGRDVFRVLGSPEVVGGVEVGSVEMFELARLWVGEDGVVGGWVGRVVEEG